jgi:hypothetical protein
VLNVLFLLMQNKILGQRRDNVGPIWPRQIGRNGESMSRKQPLVKFDRRTVLGRRIAALTAAYTAAISGQLTPLRKEAIDRAAELTAIAEQARGAHMRDGVVTLNHVVRAERNATQARRELGLVDMTAAKQRSGPDLYQQLGMSR